MEDKEQWVLNLVIPNAHELLNKIVAYVKNLGANLNRTYEKKRKIQEEDVSSKAI